RRRSSRVVPPAAPLLRCPPPGGYCRTLTPGTWRHRPGQRAAPGSDGVGERAVGSGANLVGGEPGDPEIEAFRGEHALVLSHQHVETVEREHTLDRHRHGGHGTHLRTSSSIFLRKRRTPWICPASPRTLTRGAFGARSIQRCWFSKTSQSSWKATSI